MIQLPETPKKRYDHQVVGIQWIVAPIDPEKGRVFPGCHFLTDEQGAGKTRQAIEAAQALYAAGEISHVIAVMPAPVRKHWYDPDPLFGEIAQYRWPMIPITVAEYHAKMRSWRLGGSTEDPGLIFIVTNYEYIRHGDINSPKSNLGSLMKFASHKTLLIVDESHNVGNYRAKQTRAVYRLRKKCGRVVLMTGTPEASGAGGSEDETEDRSIGSIASLYAQANILDPRILECPSWTHYKARYAIMGGWRAKQIIGWHKDGVADVQRRLAPYVLRRLKKDCMDLPERLPTVTLTVPLNEKTWKFYKQMRDDMMMWLTDQRMSFTRQAGVRVMRLAQITSGFVGGLKDAEPCADCKGDNPECEMCGGSGIQYTEVPPEFIGDEKLKLILRQISEIFSEKADAKIVIWCRFVLELHRLAEALAKEFPRATVGKIVGGQSEEDRSAGLRLLKPTTSPDGPVIVTATPGSGSVGLDFAAGSHVFWGSHGTSLRERSQGDERVHRAGQVNRVWSADVCATGPSGQRTIDHTLIRSMRRKENAAAWTCAAWVTALKEESEEE